MKALTKTQYEAVAAGIKNQVEREYIERMTLNQHVAWGRNVDRTENEARIATLAELVGWYIATFKDSDPSFNEDYFRIACGFVNN